MAHEIHSNASGMDYGDTSAQWIGNSSIATNVSVINNALHPPPGQMLQPPHVIRLQIALHVLKIYYEPCLVGFGILGNIFSCVIILRSKLSNLSFANYLAAILVADSLFLVNLFLLWIVNMGVDLFRVGALCHATTLLSHASSFLSVWYTTCLAVDRLLYLLCGSNPQHIFSALRAKIAIVTLAIIAIAVFRNMSLIFGVVHYGQISICTPQINFHHALHTLNKIDVFLNCLLPYACLITIFIIGTAMACRRHRNLRVGSRRSISRTPSGEEYERGQRTGPICFIGYFLVMTLPSQSFRVFIALQEMSGQLKMFDLEMVLIQNVLQYPLYTRSSLNIVILLLVYSGFRASASVCLISLAQFVCDWVRKRKCERKGETCDTEEIASGFMNIDICHEESISFSEEHTQEVTV